MISVRSFQRSDAVVSDPIKAITFPKDLFLLQVVYKSEPAGSDNYIL